MFWIYLAIFILAVFTPELIEKNFYALSEKNLEELILLFLLTYAFILFLARESQLVKKLKEKIKIQHEAKFMNKDLTNSYLYIGEANRKLDIIKNIAINIPKQKSYFGNRKNPYESIIEAITIFSKSTNFVIRFISAETKETLEEIRGGKKASLKAENDLIIKKKGEFFETEHHFIFVSFKSPPEIICAIAISKKIGSQKIKDPDIFIALASLALGYFCMSERSK